MSDSNCADDEGERGGGDVRRYKAKVKRKRWDGKRTV
jgi:hypothetical protein